MIDIHSLEVLEFPRVKELAAAGAGSARGIEWVRALEPSIDHATAMARLDLTDELRRLLVSKEGFPRLDTPEVRDALHQLEAAGVVLEPHELKALAATAALMRLVRERLIPRRGAPADTEPSSSTEGGGSLVAGFPRAAAIAARLVPCPEFERAVAETFGPHDDILDSASGTLRQLRRNTRTQRERILGRLESSTRGNEERLVTLRGDRYVVAVKASDRNDMGGGIVHDRSGTGATLYLEPLGVVEDNNRLVELLVEEREEIRRILAALSEMARARRHDLAAAAESLAELDGHRALASLAEAQQAVRPRLADGAQLVLNNFRHPLLLADRSRQVVPLQLRLGDPDPHEPADPRQPVTARVLLLTGPNMGGKTVALKGVGLACVMAAAGFHLPADNGTEVPLLEGLVADIGDEQSIQHDLSTFASHLRRWIEAVQSASPRCLALLDEIGAGTDPSEGAALAQAVLERLADAGGLAFVTTHLGALKRFASKQAGIMNGSMLFDPVSERPLYRLEPGLPGQSRALEMARRLGLSASLIERAGALVGTEEKEIQTLLSQLETARVEAEAERRVAADAVAAASTEREAYVERIRRVDSVAEGLRLRAAREAQRILARAEVQVRDAQRALDDAARKSTAEAAATRRELAAARQVLSGAQQAAGEAAGTILPTPGRAVVAPELTPGARLWSVPLASWVTVVAAPDGGGKVRVERNGIRVEMPISGLRAQPVEAVAVSRIQEELPPDAPARRQGAVAYSVPEGVRGEVDLRGLMADEAITRLESYLDEAGLAGFSEVRIIHGKGTGALRNAVTKWLADRPDVVSYRLGEAWEGSTGVTVARFEA